MARPKKSTIVLAAALALGVALPLQAQRSGDGYLFHSPEIRLSLRGGYDRASANSDIFDEAMTNLTLKKRDFSGLMVGGEVAFAAASRIDLSLDVGYSRAKSGSEFRKYIDNNNLPIQQTTTFERVPLTANVRAYLVQPGRSIGSLAWIPAKIVPWVGAGAGMIWYRFRQQGDFVNFKNFKVFPSDLDSTDWTAMMQGMVGVDVSLTPLIAVRGDARYIKAKAKLGRDFDLFDRIDLSGAQATLGLSFRL